MFKAGMEGWDTASILALPPLHTRLVRLSRAVRALMREHGIPAGNLRHEYFEFR